MASNNDWFDIWYEDKQSMLEIMAKNMADDLKAGYNFFGNCIQRQLKEIDEYKKEFDARLEKFADMEQSKINHWCYYDMLRRGVITR